MQGSATAKQVLSAELQLKQAVASGAGLLAAPGSSAVYKVLARRMFKEFAGMIAGHGAPATALTGRRMAQAGASFSFSNSTLLQELLTAVQSLAQADPDVSGQLANITNVTAVVQVRAGRAVHDPAGPAALWKPHPWLLMPATPEQPAAELLPTVHVFWLPFAGHGQRHCRTE